MAYLPPLNGGRLNASITGNTAGVASVFSTGTMYFSGGNNITLSQSSNTLGIIGPAAAAAGSNTFGAGSLGNISGNTGYVSGSNLQFAFAGGNNITLSQSITNGSATITVSALNQSVQTQSIIQALYGANAAVTASTGTVAFSNANGVSFGLNGNTMTASHNALTSQSGQALAAANGSFAFQTASFNNANGVSFGTSAGGIMTASHNALTTQTNQTASVIQGISAGTTSANTGAIVFGNSNNISFGLNGQTVTASAAAAAGSVAFSAGTTNTNASALSFANSNGMVFGLNGNTLTASAPVASVAFSAGTTNTNASAISFANSNGLSFGLNGNTMTASVAAGGAGVALVAGGSTFSNGSLSLSAAGGALSIVSTTGPTLNFSVPNVSYLTGLGAVNVSTTGSTINISAPIQSVQTQNLYNMSFAGNTTGTAALVSSGTMTLAGGTNITLSQSANAISIVGPIFSGVNGITFGTNGQTVTASAAGGGGGGGVALAGGGTTYSTSTVNFAGAGGLNVYSSSNQSLIFSAPGTSSLSATGAASISINGATISIGAIPFDGGVTTAGNTAGSTGSNTLGLYFAGGNNVTLSQSTNTNGALIYVNGPTFSGSNGVTFGTNGSVITASVAAAAGAGTISNWEPIPLQAASLTPNPTSVASANGMVSFFKLMPPANIIATQFMDLMSASMASSSNSSYAGTISLAAGIYSANNSTLALIPQSSGTASYAWTNTSNNSFASLSGLRGLSLPMSITMSPGNYWIGIWSSTASVGSNGMSISQMLVAPVITNTVSSFNGIFGQAYNASQGIQEAVGYYSSTTASLPAAMPMSQIVQGMPSRIAAPYMVFKNRTW